jgi:hypothetical protein
MSENEENVIPAWAIGPSIGKVCVEEINGPETPMHRQMTSTTAGSSQFWAEATQTLYFVDWDDTLFPTTALLENWGISDDCEKWSRLELSEDQISQLEQWQTNVFLYLRTVCSLSTRVVVMTNSKRPWITKCIERWAPSLQQLFDREDGPSIVYAREFMRRRDSPSEARGNPVLRVHAESLMEDLQQEYTKCKYLAMRREASRFYSQYPDQTWKNILSVGDARYEHDAAQELAFRRKGSERENLRLKAIITPVSPTLRDLTYRLKLATLWLPALVKFDGDLDVDMNTPDQIHAIADGLGMPELRNVIRQLPLAPEDEANLDAELDELAVIVQNRVVD